MEESLFLLRFTPDGESDWARSWGEEGGIVECGGVAVLSSGEVFVTGRFSCEIQFDTGPGSHLSGIGETAIFLAKFDTSGAFLDACAWGNTASVDEPRGIAADSEGNIYVTGLWGWKNFLSKFSSGVEW